MSDHDSRRKSMTSSRVPELLALAQRRQADAELALARLDERLAEAKREWWLRRLDAAEVVDRRGDGALKERVTDFTAKASIGMGTLTLPIQRIERLSGGFLITAGCRVAEALHEGLRRLGKATIGQMHNATLPPAGQLLACSIDAAGTARITCKISDEVAAQKVEHGVYPMIELVI
jgi:hypothetical protein